MKNCTESKVTKYLNEFNMPVQNLGFNCVRIAIVKVVEDLSYIHEIHKKLYPYVAKKIGYTSCHNGIGRVIRHSIDIAYVRTPHAFAKLFGHKGRPTNSEFIARIAEDIKLQNKDEMKGENKNENRIRIKNDGA